jgi:MFS family permease
MLKKKSIENKQTMDSTRQSLYMYLDAILGFQMFLGPILTIFYIEHFDITIGGFFALDATLFLLIAIFEIPSGYLSDLFGRKKMLLVSQFFTAISMLIMLLVPNYYGALLGIIVAGIFIPLGSGNAPAILYEYFESKGELEKYQEVIGKCKTYTYIMSIVASAGAGILASINIKLPIILDIVILMVSMIITYLFLIEIRNNTSEENKAEKPKAKLFSDFKESKSGILRTTPIFLVSALLFSIFRVSYSFYQPIFTEVNIQIEYFGFIFAGFNIICSITSYFSNRIIQKVGSEIRMMMLFALLSLISFVGIYQFGNFTILLFIGIQQVLRGLFSPFFSIKLNKYIPKNSSNRVTYLSYCNLLTTIFISFSLYLFGFLNKIMEIKSSIILFGTGVVILLIGAILIHYYIIYRKEGLNVTEVSNNLS